MPGIEISLEEEEALAFAICDTDKVLPIFSRTRRNYLLF